MTQSWQTVTQREWLVMITRISVTGMRAVHIWCCLSSCCLWQVLMLMTTYVLLDAAWGAAWGAVARACKNSQLVWEG